MITFACVLVEGHIKFTIDYVDRLYKMLERRVEEDFELICLTDRPKQFASSPIRAAQVKQLPPYCRAWWYKLQLFAPFFPVNVGQKVIYFDLDVLLVSSIEDIIKFPSKLALIPDGAPDFRGVGELATIKAFNSSVMVFEGASQTDLYECFDPAFAKTLWGDQDFIGLRKPDADKMPLEWFPRISQILGNPPLAKFSKEEPQWPEEAKVVLMKRPKNAEALWQYKWFDRAWR